ncbi:hypothetical protein AXF19_10905 [Selenomonas sp. oral taxon 126]|uniref:hypothetical protein n=1 Tax=Selenomonas sp. oral taxon 126 TaxID=712528 RepID=UPI0008079CD3|nr:hypothetical protein [Selenomonas sp. oral taxon 126]ANR71432.1 hypothetical protein AXF19_10905 [Selenomonas sp. oral taxon 126]
MVIDRIKKIVLRGGKLCGALLSVWILYQVLFGFKYWLNTWFAPINSPFAFKGYIESFNKSQIVVYRKDKHSELWDMHLEEWTRYGGASRVRVLDEEVYTWEKDMGLFYEENKFYVYGSVGFYIVQSEPFHVTLLINPEVDLTSPDYKYLSKALAKYSDDELTILHSETELEERDHLFYERILAYPVMLHQFAHPLPLKREGTIDYRKLLLYYFD